MLHGRRTLRSLAAAAVVALAAILPAKAQPAAAQPAPRPRFVSINLCTDVLLLALADPDQILGLSPYARDPARSSILAEAARYPVLSGTAEEVLVIRPDIVLAGRFTKRATRAMLREQGLRVEEFDAANSIASALAQIRQMGRMVGHPERAEAVVASVEAALGRARRAALASPLTVLPLQRRGWVSGRETLTTSFLETVGLRNAGAAFGRTGRMVGLEEIVTLRPDLLLVSGSETRAEDQGSALLQHPALRELYPPARRLVLPEQMTVCGGPALAQAIDGLAVAISALRP